METAMPHSVVDRLIDEQERELDEILMQIQAQEQMQAPVESWWQKLKRKLHIERQNQNY